MKSRAKGAGGLERLGTLKIVVSDATPDADVDAIVDALSVICMFFGASLSTGGSDGGGTPMQLELGSPEASSDDRYRRLQ